MQPASDRIGNLSPLKQALLAVENMQARLTQFERERAEPIAIIGLGCRFPHADGPERFWELLRNGQDAVDEVPAGRWRVEDFYDRNPAAPGKMSTRWGGFLDAVDGFDPEFFGISPREAISMDPQQRLLLEVAWEALENAGQGPESLLNNPTGVFVGISSDEYLHRFYRNGDLDAFNAYFASGIARSVAAGRISYTLGIQGPNLSIDTACSSSLVAVHTACMYLRSKECRMALAGGVNVVLSPEIGVAFSQSRMMAADGRCKTFDSRADGFVRGEGCGIVVLKRLSDASADRDHIWAVIRGAAVNQDGRSSGLTVPNFSAQQAVIRQALAAGSVEPQEVGYVEAHGTGTALGDPIEARALATVLGPGRTPESPLIVGSVKANIGHLEAAAGVAGLIKTVLALANEEIPPQLHFREMNPHIDWCDMPVQIPSEVRRWPRGEKRRVAGVSAFGFSGTNAHVVLEEAPGSIGGSDADRPMHILALSARSANGLRQLAERYAAALAGNDAALADICHTANAGRAHFEHRLTAIGSSTEEIRSRLPAALPGKRIREREGVRAVFLFPGEEAQYAGMGEELFETQPVFRRAMEECGASREGATRLFAVQYSLARLWQSWGIQPVAVFGQGVGKYVAACIAGVYSVAEGIKQNGVRGRAPRMELISSVDGLRPYSVFLEVGPGTMLAGPSRERIWLPSLRAGRGEWEQILESLTELYELGAEVNWNGFDAPYRCRKVALPTYPFERQRYWIETKPKSEQVHLEVAGNPPARVWESRVGFAGRPYLADHRAHGRAVFPLTAYLEMALAAGGSQIALDDIVLRETLVVPPNEDQTVQVISRGESIEIFSRHERSWKQHFTARVVAAGPASVGKRPQDLCGAMQRMDNIQDYYAFMRRRGMDFGPAFRTVRELWTSPSEVVARVVPVEGAESDRIHPATLDGCFQTIAAALPEGNDDLYLPVRLERFQLQRDSAAELWAHAVRRGAVSPHTLSFDIRVFDEQGPVAEARGLEFVRVAASQPIPMFEVRWEAQPGRSAPRQMSGEWLILADHTGFGATLAGQLSERGAHCEAIGDPGRLKAVLAAKEWSGIIHLWSLDAPSTAALEAAQRTVCGSALDLVQALAATSYSRAPRLWLVTRGAQPVSTNQPTVAAAQAMLWGFANAITEEHPEWRCVRVDLDPAGSSSDAELLCAEIAAGVDDQVAFRAGDRLVRRLAAREPKSSLEESKRLFIAARGALENLQVQSAARHVVPPGCVEIEVQAAGLNFRDVLNVLGMFTGPLGSECAGRIATLGDGVEGFAVGDEVIAFAPGSHDGYAIAGARLVARKPANLTTVQAATLPTAFLTAKYTLEHLAKIRRGDRILIHAAAGGVGLAAVQIAQRAGAEIFATAGSDRKRSFLRELGVQRVLDSRSLNFAREILEITGGRGVDVILNSLAADFIAASFSALAPRGRFIEIGKRDIWTPERVDQLGKDIDYHVVDLGRLAIEDPGMVGRLLRDCVTALERGELRPLPAAIFGFDDAVSAYRSMALAQHIGKIVLRQNRCGAQIVADGTYLVTGGFGGIGAQLLRWLIQRGARNVVLVGRHQPGAAARHTIEWAETQKARVVVRLADVTNPGQVAALFSEIASSMPPLRGVLHAAGIIDDGVLTEQNWERVVQVLGPKTTGSWLLHQQTAALPLDFFVVFSSLASILGAPGQASYAAGNAFQDALAHERRRLGLPGISINWGAWAEGMAARDGFEARRRKLGLEAMSTEEALRMLEYVLLEKPAQIAVGRMDRSKWNAPERSVKRAETAAPLLERLQSESDSRRSDILREHVHALALRVLGFPHGRRLDFGQPLNELGLDSLMALEFRNLLAADTGLNLPSTLLFNYPALDDVAAHLRQVLFGHNGENRPPTKRPEPSRDPLDFIEGLSEEDVDRLLARKLGAANG
jgi:acyl transferase domain-containing protein/NADPH:quinone reductase-like Zn-dependent oxidoreductase